MNFESFYNFTKEPGIYYFRNTLNNKFYIGQAQNIRKRIIKHSRNFETNYYTDTHLYRAWRKYGIEVFEVGVLEIVDIPKSAERNEKLDELEIKYIQKYHSYGTTGYNQTLGGDGGINGYKFTDLQKERVSINSLKMSLDGRFKIYFYDILKKQYGEAPSFQIILDVLKKKNNRYIDKQICYFGRYILDRSKSKLEEKIKKYNSSEYYYTLKSEIDYKTSNLQKAIDKKIVEYEKIIETFFKHYGTAKYNRKDNKTKKEALRKEQKKDLEAGITKKEYIEKYHISKGTFYEHVKKLFPNWVSKDEGELKRNNDGKCYYIPKDNMTEEMKSDLLNGIPCHEFINKYNVSDNSFYRYKMKLEKEYGIKIISRIYKKPGASVSEEQENDIMNGISAIDYMKKYNVVEDTFYAHRKIIIEKHPDFKYIKNHTYKPKIDITLIQEDILNGITRKDFCLKYNLSGSTYKKYKNKLLKK